ncbi:hypothetical protein PJI16_03865 [Nitrospira sp. MA-1]|nr:hypothetical protein [Nitrospira sp. MA-1]
MPRPKSNFSPANPNDQATALCALASEHTPKQALAEAYRTHGYQSTDQIIAKAMGLSAVIGEQIVGTYLSGGRTDGSMMQAKGLPTVESLGLKGGGANSSRGWTILQSLVGRTQLVSILLARISNEAEQGEDEVGR